MMVGRRASLAAEGGGACISLGEGLALVWGRGVHKLYALFQNKWA